MDGIMGMGMGFGEEDLHRWERETAVIESKDGHSTIECRCSK